MSDARPERRGPSRPSSGWWRCRYLRARRKEGFISVIAGFSFIGIVLGVATLIIVMAVMNGFRQELFDRMLGLNGHVIVHSLEPTFTDYDAVAARMRGVHGVKYALPLIEGQVLVVVAHPRPTGALVRGLREGDLKRLTADRQQYPATGRLTASTASPASRSAAGWPTI